MPILAIDIGTRNLAFVVASARGKKMVVSQADLLDLGRGPVGPLIRLVSRELGAVLARVPTGERLRVVIEQQFSQNQRAFALAHAVFGYFCCKGIAVDFRSPVSKFKNFVLLGVVDKENIGRGQKRARKDLAVRLTRTAVQDLKIEFDFEQFEKQDDVADAFIYAFNELFRDLNCEKIDRRRVLYVDLS